MELLISMKAEDIKKTIFSHSAMDIPSAQTNGYFIAEIRDSDKEKIKLLHRYADLLFKKLHSKDIYRIEYTKLGFRLKRKVNEENEYMEEWENWVEFSRELYKELENLFNHRKP